MQALPYTRDVVCSASERIAIICFCRPRYSPCVFGACNITTAEAIERMNNWTLLFEPGSRLAYSNTGFALLGVSHIFLLAASCQRPHLCVRSALS